MRTSSGLRSVLSFSFRCSSGFRTLSSIECPIGVPALYLRCSSTDSVGAQLTRSVPLVHNFAGSELQPPSSICAVGRQAYSALT